MPTVTLLLKIYQDYQLKIVNEFLKSTFKGLKVKAKICGCTSLGWIQTSISGEDESIAVNYLAKEIGFCPTSLDHVEKFSTIKGYLAAVKKSREEIYIDVGVFSPNVTHASIPLNYLQAQLVDGRKVALKKIAELFGFCENLPLTIKVLSIDKEKNSIKATLSEKQLNQYRDWQKSLLDRLIILGSSTHEIQLVLKNTGLNRDVIDVAPLGMFEHALACKLGTDAVGLISKIGKVLRNAAFTVFNPKELQKFLEFSTALIF
jgi:hypothetical protein